MNGKIFTVPILKIFVAFADERNYPKVISAGPMLRLGSRQVESKMLHQNEELQLG